MRISHEMPFIQTYLFENLKHFGARNVASEMVMNFERATDDLKSVMAWV